LGRTNTYPQSLLQLHLLLHEHALQLLHLLLHEHALQLLHQLLMLPQ
jgi:hypothetical protein